MNPQRLFFGTLYRIGLTPWENHKLPAPFVSAVAKLPSGAALDVGCGTGNAAIYLARHGWAVTGVDLVDYALNRGRLKAQKAGLPVRFVHGTFCARNDSRSGDSR